MKALIFNETSIRPILDGTRTSKLIKQNGQKFRRGETVALEYLSTYGSEAGEFARAVIVEVRRVVINWESGVIEVCPEHDHGTGYMPDKDDFARRDGFKDWNEMNSLWGDGTFDGTMVTFEVQKGMRK